MASSDKIAFYIKFTSKLSYSLNIISITQKRKRLIKDYTII